MVHKKNTYAEFWREDYTLKILKLKHDIEKLEKTNQDLKTELRMCSNNFTHINLYQTRQELKEQIEELKVHKETVEKLQAFIADTYVVYYGNQPIKEFIEDLAWECGMEDLIDKLNKELNKKENRYGR